jgi:hypothetical protein
MLHAVGDDGTIRAGALGSQSSAGGVLDLCRVLRVHSGNVRAFVVLDASAAVHVVLAGSHLFLRTCRVVCGALGSQSSAGGVLVCAGC